MTKKYKSIEEYEMDFGVYDSGVIARKEHRKKFLGYQKETPPRR